MLWADITMPMRGVRVVAREPEPLPAVRTGLVAALISTGAWCSAAQPLVKGKGPRFKSVSAGHSRVGERRPRVSHKHQTQVRVLPLLP